MKFQIMHLDKKILICEDSCLVVLQSSTALRLLNATLRSVIAQICRREMKKLE